MGKKIESKDCIKVAESVAKEAKHEQSNEKHCSAILTGDLHSRSRSEIILHRANARMVQSQTICVKGAE